MGSLDVLYGPWRDFVNICRDVFVRLKSHIFILTSGVLTLQKIITNLQLANPFELIVVLG